MSPLEAVLIALAGVAAGTINTVVGSGTLITFPTLLAFGVPPVTANVSNSIGLVPGSVTGAPGYRRELVGQRSRVLHLASASAGGGLLGGLLLLWQPGAFEMIVPALILLGLVLVIAGPRTLRTGRAPARGDRRPPGPRGPVGVAADVRVRGVRRLLRRRAGRADDGHHGDRHRRDPAAAERAEECPGRARQRRLRGALRVGRRRRLADRGAHRRWRDRRRSARRLDRSAAAGRCVARLHRGRRGRRPDHPADLIRPASRRTP
ncbi:sulfite exporter TauE/SafE family protein [Nocardioides sp. B-3]|uniref:sulfite exporter TauE/SafE family protein n=1 Tax=Nocardioides sp. B-3 TaxID=2895565 RepID=UPI003FA58F6C